MFRPLFMIVLLTAAYSPTPPPNGRDTGVAFVSYIEAPTSTGLVDLPDYVAPNDDVIDLRVPPPLMPTTAPAPVVRRGHPVAAVELAIAAQVRAREPVGAPVEVL